MALSYRPFIVTSLLWLLPVETQASELKGIFSDDRAIFISWFLLLITLFMLLVLIRPVVKYLKSGKLNKTDRDSQTGFIVSTFHELVHKLKEKEKELDTLRKEAVERAEHIESYNENILQSVPSGVVSFDENHRVASINAAAQKILGVSAGECIGKHYEELFCHNKKIAEIIHEYDSLERGEVIYESASNRRLWLGLNISPLINKQGLPIGKIIVFTDITGLKALESQIKLRESLSNLGEMSAGIAHELRNPMGVIAGYTKMLLKRVPEELKMTVDSIDKEIKMMDRIISDFMSFTHPLHINKGVFDIADVLKEVADNIITDDKKINLHLNLNDCVVEADETLMKQVYTNLIQNAVDAMGEGGELTITSEKTDSLINVSIADTGYGISDEIKSKVFLPFYTTKEKGTGLGLAIVHKIIISHGGGITFESSPEGTVFNMSLPRP